MMNNMTYGSYCKQELAAFRYYTETRKFNIVITVLIIVVGLVGNSLAVFVFAQKRFRTHSSSVYLLCLCLSDGLFLLMHFFEDTLRTYIDVYTRPMKNSISDECHYLLTAADQEPSTSAWMNSTLSAANITDRFDLACGLVNYLRYFLRFVSAYVIIAFTLQRTLAIHSPFFQAKFASKTLAWSIVIALVALGLASNVWVPFLFKIIGSDTAEAYCDIQRTYSRHYFIITIVYISLIMFIPIVFIFVCNTFIIYYVLSATKVRLDLMNIKRSNTTNSSTSRSSYAPPIHSKVNGQNSQLAPEEINLISRSSTVLSSPSNFNYNLTVSGAATNSTTAIRFKQPHSQHHNQSTSNGGSSCGGGGGVGFRTNSFTLKRTGTTKSGDTNHKITRMLLLMSFSYAILNLPYFISWCLFFYRMGFRSHLMTPATKYYLFSAINLCEVFYVLNYGVHFFIYCASGKKFRQLLRSAFTSK